MGHLETFSLFIRRCHIKNRKWTDFFSYHMNTLNFTVQWSKQWVNRRYTLKMRATQWRRTAAVMIIHCNKYFCDNSIIFISHKAQMWWWWWIQYTQVVKRRVYKKYAQDYEHQHEIKFISRCERMKTNTTNSRWNRIYLPMNEVVYSFAATANVSSIIQTNCTQSHRIDR